MIDLWEKILLLIKKKFNYIIAAAENDIVRILMKKEKEVNRALTLDEYVDLIKRNIKEKTKIQQIKISIKNFNYWIKRDSV